MPGTQVTVPDPDLVTEEEVEDLIGAAVGQNFTPRGEWQPSVSYQAGNLVTYLGSGYIVTESHISPVTFDGVHLTLFVARGAQGAIGNSPGVAVLNPQSSSSTPSTTPSTSVALPGNRIFAIGDSITAYGDNNNLNAQPSNFLQSTTAGFVNPSINGVSWLAWASFFTNATLQFAGIAARGGYQTDNIKNIQLPYALTAAPSACTVLGGRNDINHSVPFSTITANLSAIYAQLVAAKILPILMTMPPLSGTLGTDTQLIQSAKLNGWIRRQAAKNNWPLIDLYTACADPSTGLWKSGLTVEGVHFTTPGAKVAGQAFANAMANWLLPLTPNIAVSQLTAAQDPNNVVNALNYSDSDSDGVPDGWTYIGGSGYTSSIQDASADGVPGKWWTLNKTSGTDTVSYLGPSFATTSSQKVSLGFAMIASGLQTGGSRVDVALVNAANTSQVIAGISNWDGDLTSAGALYVEGNAISGNVRLRVAISGGTGVLKLGRLTALNLTAAGIL